MWRRASKFSEDRNTDRWLRSMMMWRRHRNSVKIDIREIYALRRSIDFGF